MVRRGKESADTTFVDIQAQDGDKAFNWGTSSWAISKGYSPADVWAKCLSDLSKFGITEGYRPAQFVGNPSTSGMTVHAQTRDILRDFAKSQNCTWFIEDGRLNLLPIKGVLPGTVPEIGAQSGLVGTPEQTTGGLIVRTLLNPILKAGSKIHLAPNVKVSQLTLTSKFQTPAVVPSSDPQGYYKAFQCVHVGDSRGNSWYTDLVCVAVDGTAPLNSNFTQAVQEDG